MKTIVIAGASGTIGKALENFLIQKGNSVKRLVRRDEVDDSEIFWDPDSAVSYTHLTLPTTPYV